MRSVCGKTSSPAQDTSALGRSHRSKLGKNKLKKAIEDTKRILGIPADYHVGIVRAPATLRRLPRLLPC